MLKIIIKSMTHLRNTGLLAVVLILFAFTGWMPLFFIGIIVYTLLTIEKAGNYEFQQSCIRKDKLKKLRKMNARCLKLQYQVKRKVTRSWASRILNKVSVALGRHNNLDLESRVSKVADIKDDIINAFYQQSYTNLKERIVSKSLELAIVYFKIMDSYAMRLSDVSISNLNSIGARLDTNRRRLSMAQNSHFADDLKLAVETDEKLLERLKEEKKVIEKMGAKLNVIESTMSLLKQQIYADTQSDEVISGVEDTINQATALDSALHQYNKTRKKI